MKCAIFDIDGTLADVRHRLHHLDRRDWKSFFEAAPQDPPMWTSVDFMEGIRSSHLESFHIFFVSGRPEDYRKPTEAWLSDLPVDFAEGTVTLLMRPSGDHRPDHIVKEEILDNILGQGYEVEFVVDDRPSVVEMWKRRGLLVYQVHVPGSLREETKRTARLHLMVGPTHAGKTTWLASQVKYHPQSICLESDHLRFLLCGNAADQSRNDDVFKLMHMLTQTYLDAGLDVYYDATNLRRKDRIAAAMLNRGGPVQYWVFDRPLDVKLASLRPGFPEAVVRKHHQIFQSNLKDILSGDGLAFVTVGDQR
jgi:predicted kinase